MQLLVGTSSLHLPPLPLTTWPTHLGCFLTLLRVYMMCHVNKLIFTRYLNVMKRRKETSQDKYLQSG